MQVTRSCPPEKEFSTGFQYARHQNTAGAKSQSGPQIGVQSRIGLRTEARSEERELPAPLRENGMRAGRGVGVG